MVKNQSVTYGSTCKCGTASSAILCCSEPVVFLPLPAPYSTACQCDECLNALHEGLLLDTGITSHWALGVGIRHAI